MTDDRQLSLFASLPVSRNDETAERVRIIIGRAQKQSYERSGSSQPFDEWIAERV